MFRRRKRKPDLEGLREFIRDGDRDEARFFVGRKSLIRDIEDICVAVRKGRFASATFLIQGAPGAGKTALLYRLEELRNGPDDPHVIRCGIAGITDPAALAEAVFGKVASRRAKELRRTSSAGIRGHIGLPGVAGVAVEAARPRHRADKPLAPGDGMAYTGQRRPGALPGPSSSGCGSGRHDRRRPREAGKGTPVARNIIETVLGGVVLLVAAAFVIFAWRTADVRAVSGYEVTARFLKVGGLEPGADVRISGVKVGTVIDRVLDAGDFEAVVTMTIRHGVPVPVDTAATIASDGLLGGKYLRLVPGRAAETVAPGGELVDTRDFRTLEDAVSEIIFLAAGAGGT